MSRRTPRSSSERVRVPDATNVAVLPPCCNVLGRADVCALNLEGRRVVAMAESIRTGETAATPVTRDAISDVWGPRTPHAGSAAIPWPVRVDQRLTDEPDHWVHSVCVLCSTGCGMDVAVKDGRMVGVRGRAEDRVNHGRLGPKGLYGWEANQSADRLTRPLIRRNGNLEEATWDEAMRVIVERSQRAKEDLGPGAVAFYNSGQLMAEEYYT